MSDGVERVDKNYRTTSLLSYRSTRRTISAAIVPLKSMLVIPVCASQQVPVGATAATDTLEDGRRRGATRQVGRFSSRAVAEVLHC